MTDAAPQPSLEDWHAEFTKRHTVTLVAPKHRMRDGRTLPEERTDVEMVTARCVVAHRVLHGLAPKELEQLKAAFKAASVESTHPDAFDMWALQHIDSAVGDKGPGSGELALTQVLDVHASPKKLAEHKKSALEAVAKPS